MKRVDLIRHLRSNACVILREGAKHTVILNPNNRKTSTIPRHTEINNFTAKKICRDLGIKEI